MFLTLRIGVHNVAEFRVAASGMGWKGIDSGNVVTLEASKIKWAQWIRVARNFQLRVGLSDHTKEKFDGFLREVSRCSQRRFQ